MGAADASAGTPSPAAWALAAGVTCLLWAAVFYGGGSGDGSLATLGTLTVAAAAASVVAGAFGVLPLPRLDRAGRLAVLAACALTAWIGVSVVWSIAGDRSWTALGKGLVYVAFLVLGAVVASSLRDVAARGVAVSLSLVLAAAIGWALLGRAVPGLFPDGGRIARLREPVDYWNALALLAGAAVPLGLWLATGHARRAARIAGPLLVYGAVLALMLTQSRAGLLALVVGAALWLFVARAPLEGGLVALLAGVPALAVAGWAFTRPALVEDGALRADRVHDGALFAGLAVAGAVLAAVLAWRIDVQHLASAYPRRVRNGLAGAAAAVAVIGVLGLVVAVGNPVSWAGDQVSGGECANDPGRLAELCANNRPSWWKDAFEVFGDHPVAGTGALTYEIARKRVRDDGTPVLQPHSVPLQLLSDLGIVGLALGLGFGACVAVGVVSALRRLDGSEREAAVALACVPVVFGVHALVDYDLDFLAVTAPALVACGALLGAARPVARAGGPFLTAAAVVAVAAAAAVVLVSPALAERDVDRSTRLLDEGRLTAAANAADRARSLDPLALDPVYAAAAAADRAGNTDLARALYRKATDMQPENPEPWIALGLYELAARQDMCSAYAALNAAYTLDPNGRQWVPGGPLDQSRDAVNAGACEASQPSG
jgi:hypothetical protein